MNNRINCSHHHFIYDYPIWFVSHPATHAKSVTFCYCPIQRSYSSFLAAGLFLSVVLSIRHFLYLTMTSHDWFHGRFARKLMVQERGYISSWCAPFSCRLKPYAAGMHTKGRTLIPLLPHTSPMHMISCIDPPALRKLTMGCVLLCSVFLIEFLCRSNVDWHQMLK